MDRIKAPWTVDNFKLKLKLLKFDLQSNGFNSLIHFAFQLDILIPNWDVVDFSIFERLL